MKTISSSLRAARFVAAFAVFVTLAGISTAAFASTTQQALPDRIAGPIDNTSRAQLVGSAPPRALRSTDLGAVSPDTQLQGISLVFSRSAAQQQDLNQLLAAQQNPASPLYHQWLTPAQFGARFGISDNDLANTESWLQSQGFSIVSVSPSRDRITFTGPESAVESAFGTPLHYFRATSGAMTAAADTRTHIAPAHDLTLPSALSGLVLAVGNLSDYRPQSHAIKRPRANFTSSQSGDNYLTPGDIGVIYNINPAYSAGYNGAGQSIAVMGQSAIVPGDVTNFQSAAGITNSNIQYSLIPNTGSSEIYTGDEAESDLDVEYSSTIASGASINFVYTGSSINYGVFDSLIYAIEYRLANIITLSYGECEPDLGQAAFNEYESFLQQANAQGQTVINSAGDSGSSGCYGDGTTTADNVAVSYPASSSYVTGLGGTEFPTSDITYTNGNGVAVAGTNSATYWAKASGSDVIASALQYIPEQAWNDDAAAYAAYQADPALGFTPSSGGGGTSILETRPSWQTGVTGIASGSYRLVPDISLTASPNNAGFLYCSSDTGSDGVGFAGSCTNGFRVSAAYTDSGGLTVAGGTSFDAPIFAGMVAIINQAKNYATGQGNVNPELYTLASNSTVYASAFHDTPAGSNNACSVSTSSAVCGSGSQNTDYPTGTGYDEATGLGSVNLYNLIQSWPANTTGTTTGTTNSSITVTPNTTTPALSASDAIQINVSGTGGTPTGTVAVTDNGTAVSGSPFTLSGGTYTYSYSSSTTCVHKLVFSYSGDSTFAPSSATSVLVVGTCSITLSSPTATVASGSSTTVSLTVTPTGYTGTLVLVVNSISPAISNACYSGPSTVAVTGTSPVTVNYTISTGVSSCPSGATPLRSGTSNLAAANHLPRQAPPAPWRKAPAPIAFAGLVLVGCLRRRSKLLRGAAALGLSLLLVVSLGVAGMGLTGCSNGSQGATSGGGGTTTTSTTYTIGIQAHDSVDYGITATTNATLTVTN